MNREESRPVQFTKMSGAGNDFVVVDNRTGQVADPPDFARRICHRRFGVGADGLLLLERSERADFAMRYYNADGSYGGMCGNGGRCISRFAFENNAVSSREMKFEALDFMYRAKMLDGGVRLWMKDPSDFRLHRSIELGRSTVNFHFVNTGSPHCILFMDENRHLGTALDGIDVDSLGREIRNHRIFAPEGTNVTFLEKKAESLFVARTYERGVEEETLACGTGAVASAVVARSVKGAAAPVKIRVKSGEELIVGFVVNDRGDFREITLEGSAHISFRGTVHYNSATHSIADIS